MKDGCCCCVIWGNFFVSSLPPFLFSINVRLIINYIIITQLFFRPININLLHKQTSNVIIDRQTPLSPPPNHAINIKNINIF